LVKKGIVQVPGAGLDEFVDWGGGGKRGGRFLAVPDHGQVLESEKRRNALGVCFAYLQKQKNTPQQLIKIAEDKI